VAALGAIAAPSQGKFSSMQNPSFYYSSYTWVWSLTFPLFHSFVFLRFKEPMSPEKLLCLDRQRQQRPMPPCSLLWWICRFLLCRRWVWLWWIRRLLLWRWVWYGVEGGLLRSTCLKSLSFHEIYSREWLYLSCLDSQPVLLEKLWWKKCA